MCPSRNLCKTLCPEAELYASQDWVNRQERTIGLPLYSKPWPEGSDALFTDTELKIMNALLDGKSRKQIQQLFVITAVTLRRHIQNIRKKRSRIS